MNPRTGKRRGRPRSPIFNYYRRIVDDKGAFLGNQCQFCNFVSRDRSENPTYLTRHVLRSCSAPQHVKDAMLMRNSQVIPPQHFQNPTEEDVKPNSAIVSPVQPVLQTPEHLATEQAAAAAAAAASASAAIAAPPAPSPIPTPTPPPPHPPASDSPKIQPLRPPYHQSQQASPNTLTTSVVATPINVESPLTKSRRGRPKSPALQHFRRYTDDKGVFLTNKCKHCPFVSRDRSENSTLLLRHLLSSSCEAPEHVRNALRAAKGTNKTRKKLARLKKEHDSGLMLSLLRFCLAHGVELSAVENSYMRDLVDAIRGHASGVNGGNPSVIKMDPLPQTEYLDAYLKDVSLDALVKPDSSKSTHYSSNQLIIDFPDIQGTRRNKLLTSYNHAGGPPEQASAAYVASAFLLSGGKKLRYLCSKNCYADFEAGLAELVQDAMRDASVKINHVMIGRPLVDIDKQRGIPKSCTDHEWIVDVAREVEIVCQELLSQVPLLVKCVHRNKLLASFFKEDYSEPTALMLFGRTIPEKEHCHRYLAHIANLPESPSCHQIVHNALLTFEILRQSQSRHDDPQRMGDIKSFAQSLTDETSGNKQICQEVIRLLLSTQFRKDLKGFLAIMTPLSNLIQRYRNQEKVDDPERKRRDILQNPLQARTQLISNVLPDCLRTLCELYALKLPDCEGDMQSVRDHVACRLIKGVEGFPAVATDVCYIAACLNPNTDLSALQGMSVGDIWKRVLKFLESQGGQGDATVTRIVDQLKSFQQRAGVFSVPEMFHDSEDPTTWWAQHGSVAPELADIAVSILTVPTTVVPAIRYISENNARDHDLCGAERDSFMQKRRSAVWNLRLAMKR